MEKEKGASVMYNDKEWERNHESVSGENDIDITEGSYVDGVHTGSTETERGGRRRMYGQISQTAGENRIWNLPV